MMDFPVEVLEVIFSFLDVKSLRIASQVNRLWNSEIRRVTSEKNYFVKCCLREIPHSVLEQISTKHNLNLPVCGCDFDSVCLNMTELSPLLDWRLAYIYWYRWSMVPQWPSSNRVACFPALSTTNEVITSCKVTGDCILTGHVYGCVMLWGQCMGRKAIGLPHKRAVTDMLLLKLEERNSEVVETETDGTETGIDMPGHDLVVTSSYDGSIALTWLTRHTVLPTGERFLLTEPSFPSVHTSSTVLLRAISNSIFVAVSRLTVSLWRITGNKPSIELLHHSRLLCLRLEDLQQIDCFSRSLEMPKDILIKKIMRTINMLRTCSAIRTGEEHRRGSTRIWIDDAYPSSLKVWVFNKDLKEQRTVYSYPYLETMPCRPVSILLYAQMLILGLGNGYLHMHRVRQDTDLSRLNLAKPDWTACLCTDPILTLDATDTVHGPCVVAATNLQVYRVAFYPPNRDRYRPVPYDPFKD